MVILAEARRNSGVQRRRQFEEIWLAVLSKKIRAFFARIHKVGEALWLEKV